MHEFTRHCAELLEPLGSVRTKRMFGGVGIYVDEIFIAVIDKEVIYLKTDEQTLPRFQAEGCGPFCFDKEGEMVVTSYCSPPEEALESPALMLPWARLALEAALRKRNSKPQRKKAPAKKVSASAAAPKLKPRS